MSEANGWDYEASKSRGKEGRERQVVTCVSVKGSSYSTLGLHPNFKRDTHECVSPIVVWLELTVY